MDIMKPQPGKECGTFDQACKRAARFANRHGGGLETAERFLFRAGWLHATFGIESVECAGREFRYLNTGDTYSATIGQETGEDVIDTSWGDWYETAEREHCAAENAIRCGYCGDFTPCAEDWHETVCENCGNNVAG